jgi:hypothetical protein
MIRLGGLVSQKAFGKFEMGKVISNPFANAFIKEGDGEDHEVSMANNSIDTIIKMATELKAKMGEDEKQIPAWIQDHIAKAENLISQASGNYHEYGDSNESVNEDVNFRDGKYRFYSKQGVGYLTYDGKVLSDGDYDFEGGNAYWMSHSSWKGQKAFDTGKDVIAYFKKNKIVKESVNEASNTGERIQNLNNRIKVLRDKISATKSPEQKKLHSDRLKNALQSLSNIKKDHGIKAPHRESVVNEDSETNRLEKLIKNLEETNKLLLQNLNHTKSLPNNKKENIKKSIAVNLDLINYYKKWLKDYQSAANESLVKEDSPCWKGYKQIGMKDKGGRQVPNCVPEGKMNEAVSSKDMDKIKSAVEAASSFMGVGSELKKLGMKYTFATEPLAIYIVQPTPNNKVAIVNKRYASKPDFVVGDIAVGVMEGVNEISSKTPKIFVKTAAVEKKIKELMDDRKKAVVPYNSEKDPKKKEILKQILIKLTKQIQGYEKNLIQLRDMEEEYLQQMHADAELDTTGL